MAHSKALDLLIKAEEEAKNYLLPISAKEWAEITGENLHHYNIVSIDALLDNDEVKLDEDYKDRTERQEAKYQEVLLGMGHKELERMELNYCMEDYHVHLNLMKYVMIAKGKKEGAKVIVDVKIQQLGDIPYMTGIGLVPLPEEEKGQYASLSDKLKEIHKKLSDEK